MANPMPHPQVPSDPTRQRLDDLDALLQRMLALPVNPAPDDEGEGAGPADVSPGESAPSAPAPSPVGAESLAPPPGNMILTEPVAGPLPPGAMPIVSSLADPQRGFARPLPLPLLNPIPPDQQRGPVLERPPAPPPTPWTPAASSRPPAVPLLLRPLVGLNRGFDRITFALGAPGRWLRRPAGRALLGGLGLLLLLGGTAVILLARRHWTW